MKQNGMSAQVANVANTVPAPSCVLLAPYSVMAWLYKPLMGELRKQFGTKFVILVPRGSDLHEQYRPFCGPEDTFIDYPNFYDVDGSAAAGTDVLAAAHANEKRYDVRYWLDIYQQERDIAWGLMPGTLKPTLRKTGAPSEVKLARAVNGWFSFYEKIFNAHPIDLALIWPRSAHEAVCAAVAAKRGIVVTYPYTAKYKTYAYWATGAYCGSRQHELAYEAIGPCEPMPESEIAPPGRPAELDQAKMNSRYSVRHSIWETLRALYLYFNLYRDDLKQGRLGHGMRRSLTGHVWEIWQNCRYYSRFVKLCERDTKKLTDQPFVLFTFQNEPEFSVQGRCKEFHDQAAIIRQIALCLPAGCRLVIKEHAWLGHRRISYYEDLLSLPNVLMAHPGLRAIDLAKQARAVASLGGTITLEAAMFGKRSLNFSARSEFTCLKSVRTVKSLTTLSNDVAKVLSVPSCEEKRQIRSDAARFCKAIESISVNADTFYTKSGKQLTREDLTRAIQLLRNLMHQQYPTGCPVP